MATESFTRTIVIDNKVAVDLIKCSLKEDSDLPERIRIKSRKNAPPQYVIDNILNSNKKERKWKQEKQ